VNVVETLNLGKRYRDSWALKNCTLAIPSGHIVALVGPNGAGKTTLLHCAVGLCIPTAGSVLVLGGTVAGSPTALDRVGFVAQDAPLHKHLTVGSMVEVTQNLNARFDTTQAKERLKSLDIPLHRKVGKLSGGQQSQLALTLSLARSPSLLVLDEPLARLDPLARHAFMSLVMSAVAEEGISVLFSSHVISELERVADYLVVLNRGQVQVAGVIDDILATHVVLTGPADDLDRASEGLTIVESQRAGRHAQLIVRSSGRTELPQGWETGTLSLEELVLAYLREPLASRLPGPLGLVSRNCGEVTL
jgi:ABC-2 type transport system ATP-binding protein